VIKQELYHHFCRPSSRFVSTNLDPFPFAGRLMQRRSRPFRPFSSLFSLHQILIITISITLYDYLVPPERFRLFRTHPRSALHSCVASMIIRVQVLYKSVSGVQYRWNWVQRLRYHIDFHGLQSHRTALASGANLLYDKEEASADAAWGNHEAWAAKLNFGSWHWAIGRF
jgi:hypothetical protein